MRNRAELYIDVRSGSVGGAIVEQAKNGTSEIVLAIRRPIPIQAEFSSERLASVVAQETHFLLEDVRKQSLGQKPNKIHVTLGSPWYFSQTRSVIKQSDTPFQYTSDLQRNYLRDEENAFREQYYPKQEVSMIEKEALAVYLNGYRTAKPFDKRAKELRTSLYLSLTSASFLELLKKQIYSVYRINPLYWHTFPLLSLVVGNLLAQGKMVSYLLVDIGGEVSELSVIINESDAETYSFPLGAHSIVREIAKKFSGSLAEAASLRQAYIEARVSAKVEKQIESVISDIKVKWLAYLHGILEKIAVKYILPQTILIFGNPETDKIFQELLEEKEMAELFSQQVTRKIIIVTAKNLLSSWSIRPAASRIDVFLATEIFAIDKQSNIV